MMCVAPLTLDDGKQVACHDCWQCRENAINDWVGRNIAESRTAVAAHSVTLTYGRSRAGDVDHERAALLTYSDVQKYLKLLRRHGYPVRYFSAGEYGGRKGRSHWHLLLYWQERVPEHVLAERVIEAHWPHGWSFWEDHTQASVRYVCKYIQKDQGEAERQGHLMMSKKPPIGWLWFAQLAERYVGQGLAPQSLAYSFPGVRKRQRDGTERPLEFMLKDRSAEMFLDYYLLKWAERYPGVAPPSSELVSNWIAYRVLRVPDYVEDRAGWLDFMEEQREKRRLGEPLVGAAARPIAVDAERYKRASIERARLRDEIDDDMWDRWLKEREIGERQKLENLEREKSITEPYAWRGEQRLPVRGKRREDAGEQRKSRGRRRA